MTPFSYARAHDAAEAVRLGGEHGAKYLGGGTNLVLSDAPLRIRVDGLESRRSYAET